MPPDFNKVIFDIQISICQSSFLVIWGEVEISGPSVPRGTFFQKLQGGPDGKNSIFAIRPSVPRGNFANKVQGGTAGFGAPKS